MAEPVNLAIVRAEQSNLARDQTVETCLADALRQLREDPESAPALATRCVIVFGSVGADGAAQVQTHAGGTKNGFETMGLLFEALHERAD